jgi:transcriptional regulator with XRE-family HTH domain
VAASQPGAGVGGRGPVAARMLLGARLRRLREESGLTRGEAAESIRASESKISRMELGRVGLKPRDVADLLDLYRVGGSERADLLARVRDTNRPGWWHPYSDVTPAWFQMYLGLEAAATLIRTYEVQFVPGLLQTEDYARAVVRLGHGSARKAEVERRVRLRRQRQVEVLGRPDPPMLWAVVDEAALRRPVGGAAVMCEQLQALVGLVTKAPHVRLQIVTLEAGGHAAAGGSFTILRFGRPDLPDLVYIEQLTGALYLEKPEHVDPYLEAVGRLYIQAAPPARTAEVLEDILKTL